MIIGIVIVWCIAIFLSVLWGNLIDRAVGNDEWEKDRQEEDRQQEEYIKEYNGKRAEKKRRKKQVRDKVLGIMADVVTAVCTAITKFLLWIQRKER